MEVCRNKVQEVQEVAGSKKAENKVVESLDVEVSDGLLCMGSVSFQAVLGKSYES